MSKTTTDLSTAVLQELRIVRRSGGVPNAADGQFVRDKYHALYLELQDRDKTFWTEDAIDDRVFGALTKVLAGECAAAFGVQYDPGDAYKRMLILASRPSTAIPTRAEYY